MNKKDRILTTTKIYEDTLEKARKHTEKEDVTLYKFISKAVEEKLEREFVKEKIR